MITPTNDKGLRGQSNVGKANNRQQDHTATTDQLTAWFNCASASVDGRRAESLRRQALSKHGEVK